jgi:hypothetical protein
MFKSLRIKNFRSIRDSGELKMSKINVLVGANNAGKSSIIYALMLLKMSSGQRPSQFPMVTTTQALDLGSYLDLIRGGDTKRKLSLSFTFDEGIVKGRYKKTVGADFYDRQVRYAGCHVEFAYDKTTNKVEVETFTGTELDGRKIFSVSKRDGGEWSITGPHVKLRRFMDVTFWNFFPVLTAKKQDETPSKVSKGVLEWYYLSRMMAVGYMEMLQGLKYIAPIRERIPRFAMMGTMPSSELSPSGENLMRVLSTSDLMRVSKKTLIHELNYWLNTRFRLLRNIRMVDVDKAGTLKAIVVDDVKGAKGINIAFTGCGISQLVPIILQTVLMRESECLLVEQPEIHLHPSAQADLADLFIENAKYNKQFIIETHSEHLLLRLRRRIAEGRIKSENVRVFAVEKKGANTTIRGLNLKSDGHFEEWPKGFFEEGYKEALAIAEAGFKE